MKYRDPRGVRLRITVDGVKTTMQRLAQNNKRFHRSLVRRVKYWSMDLAMRQFLWARFASHPGTLQTSIAARRKRGNLIYDVGSFGVDYAQYVEFDHQKRFAFVYPPVAKQQSRMSRDLRKIARKEMRRGLKGRAKR